LSYGWFVGSGSIEPPNRTEPRTLPTRTRTEPEPNCPNRGHGIKLSSWEDGGFSCRERDTDHYAREREDRGGSEHVPGALQPLRRVTSVCGKPAWHRGGCSCHPGAAQSLGVDPVMWNGFQRVLAAIEECAPADANPVDVFESLEQMVRAHFVRADRVSGGNIIRLNCA
jgi:hypothetical protein